MTQFTEEQERVLDTTQPSFKVNAVAGSGKTATLLEYARRRPNTRFLYLAYNRSAADEIAAKARSQGLGHVTVRTFHALAFHATNASRLTIEADLSAFAIMDRYLGKGPDKYRRLLAWLVRSVVLYYLNSTHRTPDERMLNDFEAEVTLSKDARELLDSCGHDVLGHVAMVLGDMRSGALPAVHDFYLKLFQFVKKPLGYDTILVDEAQDASGVTLATLDRQACAKVFMGDSYQQIYGFRHAINALERLPLPAFSLSRTFRFGDFLAQRLMTQLNPAYALLGVAPISITGTEAFIELRHQHVGTKRPLTIIARSGLGLFETAMAYTRDNAERPGFEGGVNGYSFMNQFVASVFNLSEGKREKVSDPTVQRFGSFGELVGFAEATHDQRILQAVELVTTYGAELFGLARKLKECAVVREDATVLFSTTHKAKGQEYPAVRMVPDDFISKKDIQEALDKPDSKVSKAGLREELNIYYVAATRACEGVSLASF